MSVDASVVVGSASNRTGAPVPSQRAFRWTQASGIVSLGTLNGGSDSRAAGVSADGSVVVGTASYGSVRNANRAFRCFQILAHHFCNQLLEGNIPTPAEPGACLGSITKKRLDLGWPEITPLEFHHAAAELVLAILGHALPVSADGESELLRCCAN